MCENKGVIAMQDKNTMNLLLQNSPSGTITAKQVTDFGMHRSVLQELVDAGDLYRYGRGIYVRSDAWEDEFYLLQCKYGRGFIPMIRHCIYLDIQTERHQNIR